MAGPNGPAISTYSSRSHRQPLLEDTIPGKADGAHDSDNDASFVARGFGGEVNAGSVIVVVGIRVVRVSGLV
jgi:hypothetical protein